MGIGLSVTRIFVEWDLDQKWASVSGSYLNVRCFYAERPTSTVRPTCRSIFTPTPHLSSPTYVDLEAWAASNQLSQNLYLSQVFFTLYQDAQVKACEYHGNSSPL
jgi:hypothetical protein